MKEIKKTIEQVVGYEAFDGTKFKTPEECSKYEESAAGVVKRMAQNLIVGKTDQENLMGCGYDSDVEILRVKNAEDLRIVNQYIEFETRDSTNVLPNEYIGKDVILFWSYDRDYCWWYKDIDALLMSVIKEYCRATNTEV